MEQELRIWLRLCIFFGIYIKPCDDVSTKEERVSYKCTSSERPPTGFLRNKKSSILTHQRLYIFLIALMICVFYVHGLYGHGAIPNLLLTWLTSMILFHLQVLTNFLILMEAIYRHRQHADFLLLLDEIEVSLKLRLRLDVQKQKLLKSLHQLIAYVATLSLIGLILFMITSMWLNYIGFFWNGLWSLLTMRVRIIQLLLYVRTLQHYLDFLCVKLRQIVAYRLAPQQQLLDIDYDKLTSMQYLLAIKEIYALIYKAFYLLNYFGGWSLFGIMICYVLDISSNIYWTLMSLDGFFSRQHYYIAGPLAIIPRIVIICLLCYWCNKCKELGQNVNQLVSRIQALSSTKSVAPYHLVLHQFSAQLQLQRIQVTAHNCFVFDMRLLVTIFTETATNLVILLQFLSLWLDYNENT